MTKKAIRPNKLNLWFRAFIDESNPDTFLNATASARVAGYRAASENAFACIGYQNYRKLQNRIKEWLDDIGLSDARLKIKLVELLDCKETRYFQKDGIITDQVDIEALEVQRRTLDMIFRLKGLYAPERLEHTGRGGGPTRTEVADMADAELLKIVSGSDGQTTPPKAN